MSVSAPIAGPADTRTLEVSPPARAEVAEAASPLPVFEEHQGQYIRLDELGRGAHSIVWRARDESIGREVALKELKAPADAGAADSARARFLREARLTAQLDHPGIAAVHVLARRADGTLYATQKLVRGETLQARLARCRSLRERLQLLPHLIDASQAVAYAHARGVVHRDLKPSNIMVGEFGETVVVDWGLAKKRGEPESPGNQPSAPAAGDQLLTAFGTAIGTPAYMSPEQARGDIAAIGQSSDVFSLGVILYELLAGRRPFEGATAKDVIDRVLDGRFARVLQICPEAPPELAAVAERALRPERDERYPGAGPLASELSEWRAGGKVQAYRYRSIELLQRFVARNRALSAVVAAALVALIGFSLVMARQLRVTRDNLAEAFIDRAQAAEQDLDWARAAAAYAASLVQRDTQRARWGVALDASRMPRRSSQALEHVAKAGVAFLADGRGVLVQSPGGALVVASEVGSGRELWRATLPNSVNSLRLGGPLVLAFYQNTERWRAFDVVTGAPIADGPDADSSPCLGAAGPPRALWRVTPGGERLEVTRSPPIVLAETRLSSLVGKCVVNADGTRLATYIAEEGGTVVWDLQTLKPILRRPGPLGASTFTRYGLALPASNSADLVGGPQGDFSITGDTSPEMSWLLGDGRLLVRVTTTNRGEVMDLEEQRMIASLPLITMAVAISEDPSRILAVGRDSPDAVDAWTLPRPASLELRAAEPGDDALVEFSGDANRFAIASRGRVEVWSRDGKLVRALPAERLPGTGLRLSADGSRLTVVATAMRAATWDVEASAAVQEYECQVCLGGVAPSADGSRVLAASTRQEVTLWDVARRERLWKVPMKGYFGGATALSGDGALAIWDDDLWLIIAATGSGAALAKVPFDRHWSSSLTFSHDSKRIAAGGNAGISVWRADGSMLWSTPAPLVKPYAARVLWSLDDSKLIVGDDQSSILDSSSGELLARVDPETRSPQPRSFVSPDLRYVVKRTRTSWQLQPLPAPADGPPSGILATILDQAGLALNGAELSPSPLRTGR
jgi:hypothetical protein